METLSARMEKFTLDILLLASNTARQSLFGIEHIECLNYDPRLDFLSQVKLFA